MAIEPEKNSRPRCEWPGTYCVKCATEFMPNRAVCDPWNETMMYAIPPNNVNRKDTFEKKRLQLPRMVITRLMKNAVTGRIMPMLSATAVTLSQPGIGAHSR